MVEVDNEEEVGLAAYTNRLSGRPGDAIRFHVSTKTKNNDGKIMLITANLKRCICADPNPKGPGCIEEDASQWFDGQKEFLGRHQNIKNGSFAKSRDVIHLPSELKNVSVEIWIFPSHICKELEVEASGSAPGSDSDNTLKLQCIWSWGELSLYLKPNGCLFLCHGKDDTLLVSSNELFISPRKWYHCKVTIDETPTTATTGYSPQLLQLTVMCQERISKKVSLFTTANCNIVGQEEDRMHQQHNNNNNIMSLLPRDAHFHLATGGTFNGMLESPLITMKEEIKNSTGSDPHTCQKLLASWDTSQNTSEWTVPSNTSAIANNGNNPLILYNHPTRAVRGRLWDGSEMHWKHKPSHYGGIHFHDDDCYNFDWECDFEWKIPEGIPSGIYIVRLSNDEGQEEALPLFVCPPLAPNRERKKICILMSTFTYVMYGNHARADFKPSWLDRIRDWNAYPHNPSQYPNYGCSTYNFHSDNSGICFASHLRPLFNLRPQYLTFGDTSCSGLRHFPADTHLIAFMHHHNIDYDIITDHELHKDGVTAIAGYETVLTGTHPEYHTLESLNALQEFRDDYGGNLIYLGGNGFYWRIAANDEDASILEIRRAEDGVRTWASEPGEYYHMLGGGSYGGLWRRNDRPPQLLAGVGFTAQGSFASRPYQRVCYDKKMDWLFDGVRGDVLGDFGFSGNGAAGFELDCTDSRLDGCDNEIIILAQSFDEGNEFMLVPEEILTTYSNLSGSTGNQARRSDMVYFKTVSGAQVFSVGSITFCGSLPWNNFDNNISTILLNVIRKFSLGVVDEKDELL